MTRKICVVTGSRADYGLLRHVMRLIAQAPDMQLQVMATGPHLSPEYGLTVNEIVADGFTVDRAVESLLSADTASAVAKSMGLGLIGFGEAISQLRPDLMLVLGDRFEIFAAVAAALVARVPVAHAHGGEVSEGAFDEGLRHAITKMSHLHFVAAEPYRRRVIQMGEDPQRVYLVGGLGVDAISRMTLLDRAELEESIGIGLGKRSILVTFHPATLDEHEPAAQMAELLAALEGLGDATLIFTQPNADTRGRILTGMIEEFVACHGNARFFESLGQLRYLSCLKHVDGVVGNSSSGLAEAPSLGTGTVNIGIRQDGRLKAASVIDCVAERGAITEALRKLLSPAFQDVLATTRNPYGDGGAGERIVDILREVPLSGLSRKRFHDLDFSESTSQGMVRS